MCPIYAPDDSPLTLTEAAAVVPALRGKRLHVSTLWRWARRGCKARNGQIVRLEHGRVGGQITTTRAALDRFYVALAENDLESFRAQDATPVIASAPAPNTATPTAPGTRRAAIERAKETLKAAGI